MDPVVRLLLVVILIVVLVSVLPVWPHAAAWGYWPGGVVGLVLVIVIILLLLGRL